MIEEVGEVASNLLVSGKVRLGVDIAQGQIAEYKRPDYMFSGLPPLMIPET